MADRELLRGALEAVRLNGARDLTAAWRERRRDVVEWRALASGSRPHRPEPWASEEYGVEPCWLDAAAEAKEVIGVTRAGYDAHGRLAVVDREWLSFGDFRVDEVWSYGEDWSDVLTEDGAQRLLFSDGRLRWSVGVEHGTTFVRRWSWDGDHAARIDTGTIGSDWHGSETYLATLGADGRLALLERGHASSGREEVPGDELAELLAALDHASTLVPDHAVFDARVERTEPQLRPHDELVELLVPALERAVVAAHADAGVERPFVLVLEHGEREYPFPPQLVVGGASFRDRARSTSADRHAALTLLPDAQPPDGATLRLLDHLDEESLRACRELNWATRKAEDEATRERALDAEEALGEQLAARLNGRGWDGADPSLIVLVHLGRRPLRPFVRAARTLGKAHVQAFRATIAPRAAEPPTPPEAVWHDRDALAAHLGACGLEAHAQRLAHEVAQVTLRLVGIPDPPRSRSRLGALPVLPPDVPWPRSGSGRAHSFLAAIDLAEVPSDGLLPTAGWLLFFADLDDENAVGMIDIADNSADSVARLLHVPAGVEPVPATMPPGASREPLDGFAITFVPRLTLPGDELAGQRLGLDPLEADRYARVVAGLTPDETGWGDIAYHWMLGHQTGVQGYASDDGSLLLLQLGPGGGLGLEVMDGGTIQFRIAPAALAAGDWGAAMAYADSC